MLGFIVFIVVLVVLAQIIPGAYDGPTGYIAIAGAIAAAVAVVRARKLTKLERRYQQEKKWEQAEREYRSYRTEREWGKAMGLFSGSSDRSDHEIWARFNAFEVLYNEATALMDSSVGLETKGDAAIRAHIVQLKAMAERIRQEYAVLSDLAPRARDRELKEVNQRALKDIQWLIGVLDDGVRLWEALLADAKRHA